MRIAIVCASGKQPAWVEAGFDHYARRLRDGYSLSLTEVPLARRGASVSRDRAVADEGRRILTAAAGADHLVALDERGAAWTTRDLAGRLDRWSADGSALALMVGGPDGLSADCRQAARESWSLSALTLPHGLVRVLIAEAVYRAWSLNRGHPYHRG